MVREEGAPVLSFYSLGGLSGVTRNLHVYEEGGEILIIDCGVGFPQESGLGIELVLPDISSLLPKKGRIRGIVITHGHEDHFGALPYLLSQIEAPVFATPLVLGFLKHKLLENRAENLLPLLREIVPRQAFSVGHFRLTPFLVNHSVPEAVGYLLETDHGKIVHLADFKFDFTPAGRDRFDLKTLVSFASGGVALLLSDCLGSLSEGFTRSEQEIEESFSQILRGAKGQVIFTTLSSNINRIGQMIRVGRELGRRFVFLGRSIEQNIGVARSLGYLSFKDEEVVAEKNIRRVSRDKLIFLVAGAYAQSDSALARLVEGENRLVGLEKGATVIFSADPSPPGVKDRVDVLVNKLTEMGAQVHCYATQENLHVSGHGSLGDLKLLLSLVAPRAVVPIGGTRVHQRAYTQMASEMGFAREKVFELVEGQVLELLTDKSFRLGRKFPVGEVVLSGNLLGEAGPIVLSDRKRMAQAGMVIVAVPVLKGTSKALGQAALTSRGLVYTKNHRGLFEKAQKIVEKEIHQRQNDLSDWHSFKVKVENDLLSFLIGETGLSPLLVFIKLQV